MKNEHLLSMRQTIDLDIRNAEHRMADKFQSAVDETRAQADRSAQAFDEKFSEIKSEVAGSKAAAQDEYLEILHTMSERIKDLDSRYQEVLLTSENGLEWVQEKQGNLVTQLREDLEAKMEAIAAKAEALAIQSEESVTKSQLAEALAPLEAKATALEADISGKVDAIRTTTEDLGRDLAEIANRSKTEIANQAEELSKIQNAQRDLYCGLYCTSKVLKEKILSVETKLESIAADKPSMEAPLGPGETKVVTRLGDEVEAQGARIAGVEREAAISQKHVEHLSATIESRAEEARIHLAQSLAQVREVSLISLAEIPPSLPPVGGFPLGFPARVSRSAYISRSGLRVSSFPMEPLRGTPFGGREGTTQWETLAGKGTKIVLSPRAGIPTDILHLIRCVTLQRHQGPRFRVRPPKDAAREGARDENSGRLLPLQPRGAQPEPGPVGRFGGRGKRGGSSIERWGGGGGDWGDPRRGHGGGPPRPSPPGGLRPRCHRPGEAPAGANERTRQGERRAEGNQLGSGAQSEAGAVGGRGILGELRGEDGAAVGELGGDDQLEQDADGGGLELPQALAELGQRRADLSIEPASALRQGRPAEAADEAVAGEEPQGGREGGGGDLGLTQSGR